MSTELESRDPARAAELAKLRAEAEEAQLRVRALARETDRPWPLRILTPSLFASLVLAVGGALLGDSLLDRSRAEIRRDVLKLYFSVDNDVAGKRAQMVTFMRAVLAPDDPRLEQWLDAEEVVVESRRRELEEQIAALDIQIAEVDRELEVELLRQQDLVATVAGGDESAADLAVARKRLEELQAAGEAKRLLARKRSLAKKRAGATKGKREKPKAEGDPLAGS